MWKKRANYWKICSPASLAVGPTRTLPVEASRGGSTGACTHSDRKTKTRRLKAVEFVHGNNAPENKEGRVPASQRSRNTAILAVGPTSTLSVKALEIIRAAPCFAQDRKTET